MKIHRILVPVDFSPGSYDAVRHARGIAERFGSDIHVLCAVPRTDLPLWALDFFGREELAQVSVERVSASDRLAALIVAERLDPSLTTGLVRVGRPDEVIRQYAQEIDADLIVMGAHGSHDAMPGIGAVLERVLDHPPCPVVTVPPMAGSICELMQPPAKVLEPVAC